MSALPTFTVTVRDGAGETHRVAVTANTVLGAHCVAIAHMVWRAGLMPHHEQHGPRGPFGVVEIGLAHDG